MVPVAVAATGREDQTGVRIRSARSSDAFREPDRHAASGAPEGLDQSRSGLAGVMMSSMPKPDAARSGFTSARSLSITASRGGWRDPGRLDLAPIGDVDGAVDGHRADPAVGQATTRSASMLRPPPIAT